MYKNYFTTAWRNLIATPLFSTLNVLGLALGLCCAILMLTYLNFLRSFDSQFTDAGQLVFLATETSINGNTQLKDYTISNDQLALIQSNLTGIKTVTVTKSRVLTIHADIDYREPFYLVDEAFFEIFDFLLKKGIAPPH